MSEEKPIQVSMLGGCSLYFGGVTLDGKNVRSKRIWRLLEYLITYRFRCIPQDELIDLLYQEERSDAPTGALKTLVHRARAALSQLGFADGNKLVLKCADGYRWNPELPITLDTECFDNLLQEASHRTDDPDRQLRLRMEALELYKGDFLPEAATEIWAMSINTYFHFRYMSAVNEALEALVERERFEEAVSVAGKAIAVDPYVESLYFNLILALLNTNRTQAAREQYENMSKLFYREFGIAPSKELQALYKRLVKSENGVEKDIDAVKTELCKTETVEGAFFCEYEIFRDFFRHEQCAAKREGRSVHICMINIEGKDGALLSHQTQDTVMRRLCDCIRQNLRGGDVFSRYSVSQFIILLPVTSKECGEKVLERVARRYRHDNPHSPAAISFTVKTIALA